jgi:choline-sulfatase
VIAQVLAAALAAAPAAQSLVLVTLDTTRADHLGCYGASRASTPHLDALARRGVRFDAALSPAPLTLPAHASLFSGSVPRRHGARDNSGFTVGAGVPLLAETLRRAGYDTRAFVSSYVLDRGTGLARGFAQYDDTLREERDAGRTVDAAIASIPTLAGPFFLWVHLYDPHLPYAAPEPYASKFKDRPYDGEIAYMDAQIGRLLDALRRRPEPQLVAAAADHGESLGEHGEGGHGVFLYQATQRVPLILAGRGVPQAKAVAATVGLVDLAPTLLDLLGQPPLAGADGHSLVPLLADARGTVPPHYEMETFYTAFAYGWSPLRALVAGPLKYVSAPRPEMYELPTDPRETRDLARVPARAARMKALSEELSRRTKADQPLPADDPETQERRERLGSLGYVGGTTPNASSAIDPKDGILWLADLEAARRLASAGNPTAAAASIEKLLAKNPENLQALFALVGARRAAGDAPRAIDAARRAVALAPKSATARLHLANALAGSARSEAERAYDEAIALAPRLVEAYLDAAVFQLDGKNPEAALRVLERARAAGIADPSIETSLGGLEQARGKSAAASAAYERAIALDPKEAKALEGLGKLAFESGAYVKAEGWYERALEAKPSAALAKTLGAIRLEALDDLPGAKAAFRRALELAPDDPDAKELRALLEGTAP